MTKSHRNNVIYVWLSKNYYSHIFTKIKCICIYSLIPLKSYLSLKIHYLGETKNINLKRKCFKLPGPDASKILWERKIPKMFLKQAKQTTQEYICESV